MNKDAEHDNANPIIDCDADPLPWRNARVVGHQKGGQLVWDAAKVQLRLTPYQASGRWVTGYAIFKRLKESDAILLNANVLDYLLANQHLIPESWKEGIVVFWGTIYSRPDYDPCQDVRTLGWNSVTNKWDTGYCGLEQALDKKCFAAVYDA